MKLRSFAILIIIILTAAIINYELIHFYDMKQYNNNSDTLAKFKILIVIDERKLYLFKDNECIKTYPIATGKYETPSPIGQWKIISKDTWGEGFGGRWLGLNVLWGTYGIHGTTTESSIGSAASHGCIRMFRRDIRDLYDKVPLGTIVVIQNGSYGPFGYGLRNLKIGDTGADVREIQRKLKQLGYYTGIEDGMFGSIMNRALNNFQTDNDLPKRSSISKEEYNAMGIVLFE